MDCTSPDEHSRFDELGRRAGAAMRHPAPDTGLATITRRARRRSTFTAVGSLAALAIVLGTTAFVAAGTRDAEPAAPIVTTTVPVPTTIAGSVELTGSSSRTVDSIPIPPGDYVVTFAPDSRQCAGWVFHFTGEGQNEDPFRQSGGGSSPKGASVRAHLKGGLYTFTIETTCPWRFTVTPA